MGVARLQSECCREMFIMSSYDFSFEECPNVSRNVLAFM